MSKSNREQSEKDRLEKENRLLKSENKQLKKRLRRASKGYRKRLTEEVDLSDTPDCPSCYKGFIKEIIVVGRSFKSCSVCDWKQIDTSGKL